MSTRSIGRRKRSSAQIRADKKRNRIRRKIKGTGERLRKIWNTRKEMEKEAKEYIKANQPEFKSPI